VKQLKTCCFIGDCLNNQLLKFEEHNPYYLELKAKVKEQTINLIEDLAVIHFISGMDIGVEQYAAEIVLDLKKIYPKITLEGVLPFETQASKWSEFQRDKYYSIMKRSDKETLFQYHYTDDCIKKHNQYIINKSKFVILVCNGVTNRVGKLISYAKSIGRVVFIVDMVTLDIKPNIKICR